MGYMVQDRKRDAFKLYQSKDAKKKKERMHAVRRIDQESPTQLPIM